MRLATTAVALLLLGSILGASGSVHSQFSGCSEAGATMFVPGAGAPYLFPVPCVGAAGAEFAPVGTREIAPGLTYRSMLFTPPGRNVPSRVFILRVDTAAATVDVTRESDVGQTTSAFASGYNCDVAVNASRFNMADPRFLWGWAVAGRSGEMGQGVPWTPAHEAWRTPTDSLGCDSDHDQPYFFAMVAGAPVIGDVFEPAVVPGGPPRTPQFPPLPELLLTSRTRLVRDGIAVDFGPADHSCDKSFWEWSAYDEYAWIGAGLDQDDGLIIVAVEHVPAPGEPDDAPGLHLGQLADLLVDEGAVDAVTLDGGGSVSVFLRNIGLVNRPKYGEPERSVSTHIGFNCTRTGRGPEYP